MDRPPLKRSLRRAALIVGRPALQLLVIAAAVEYLLLPQVAGARKSLHLLTDVDNIWLLGGFVAEVVALLAYARLTQVVLQRPQVSYWRLLRIDLSTLAVSHVVPAGSAAGLGLGYRLLTRSGVPGSQAAIAKSLQAVGSAVVLNVILFVALAVALVTHGNNPVYGPIAGAGVLLMAAVAVAVLLVLRGEERAARILSRVLAALPRVGPDTGRRIVNELATLLRQLGSDRRLLRRILGWAAANWLLDALSLWCFVRAFGHALGPDGILVAHGLANVAAVVPVTPGGLGIVEGVLVPTLVAFSTPRGVAILGVIGWRLVQFWLPIPIGLAAYLSLTALPENRRRAESDAEPTP